MQPLHLYGGRNGSWEVKPPALKLRAPAMPEPTPGINIWRDTMERQKWLQKVAVHCDEWLMKISSFAAKYIAATERVLLFTMLTDLPSIEEILLANSDMSRCMYHIEEKSSSGPEANAVVEEEKEERSSGPDEANEVVEEQEVYYMEEQRSSGPTKANEVLEEEDDVINDDNDYCASCNSRYKANAFWICCDECGKWYHEKCVNITSSEAEHKERYECPERVGWS
ncbi:hypothetical protein SORBI_3009G115950 [Sorghum bicolor]|uniref:PHD finger protein ALFIN-LIKE n=1 Tax=Sorghum bicolor TaxID=4558 RepID=A0A1Z5R275_SORBI|nr:hypothetical protein SORBI_3009G115950 [Sorghum bicolor]